MPSKKKKYNARFPAGRIKKIMQTDEEVGKVAQAVPVIISRTLELFVESLLTKTLKITNARNAKTLSTSHMKQCIISESRFDFLRDLVKNIPDIGINEDLSGSEAGYGVKGTSPASTSTSSSSASYSNGGAGSTTLSYEVHSMPLQRSESYSPASATGSMVAQNSHQTGKRSLGQGSSLNFYKEISLEETSSPSPPKLNRLNSAPAGGVSAALPFKIDILPNIPAAAPGATTSVASKQATPGAITPQITYKLERLPAPSTSPAATLEPVIKLHYSNLRLPATSTLGSTAAPPNRTTPLQPTIKIDLSSLATSPTMNVVSPQKYAATAGVGKHYGSPQTSSSSTSSSATPLPSPVTTVPPVFSALSSTIPGMDEDYDDI
ncbi:dr1-associated corepressor [Anopheles nili]|uniref:dr1-associated corepressor n=1 Tax=Anopheles nili TaxID=185578 RepID=UPI00237AD83B|nr:dr1-associated corepressor [Anopheles nili]